MIPYSPPKFTGDPGFVAIDGCHESSVIEDSGLAFDGVCPIVRCRRETLRIPGIGEEIVAAQQDVTVKDAADFLRVSEKTVYRWIQQGVVPCFRVAGQYRFHRSELEAWARYKRIGSGFGTGSGAGELAQAEEGVDLADAIRRGGLHYKIEGDSPEAIYRSIAEIFPLSPPRDPAFRQELAQTLIEREALAPTGVGKGMAIPHPRHPRDWGLGEPVVGVFFLDHPVPYKSFDSEPVFVLFVLLCSTVKGHLRMLAQVSHLLREPETQALLRGVPTRTELLDHIAHILDAPAHGRDQGA